MSKFYRAKAGEPLSLTAEGATAEEAVRNLRESMACELKNGKQLLSVDLTAENPWLALAGMHNPDDPTIQEWKKEMTAYRQEVEENPDRP